MIKKNNKFKFTEDYQWDLLKYTVQDKNGEAALKKYDDDYFALIEHQVIAHALHNYYRKERRIPGQTILKETIVKLLNSKNYVSLVTKDEQKNIINLINRLYKESVVDGDKIYEMCKKFRSHIKLKSVIESIDINDYDNYDIFHKEVAQAIHDEDEIEETKSSFLLNDIKNRQFRRKANKTIFPTPFRQINQITNAGGYELGSIIVILDKQKRGKTTALINVARGYLKMRKKVLVIDTENGKDNLFYRIEQSIMNLTKREIDSNKYDDRVYKRFRKYARLGGEIVVERLPALVSTTNDIQNIMDKYYRDYGIRFDVIILDYAAKLGSITKKDGDRERISDVYIELDNLIKKNDIEHLWTANHVQREAARKRMKTRYQGEDIANCIDIVRHSQAIFGINRSPEEEESGLFRFELVEQRDGLPSGRAVFKVDMSTQRVDELSKGDRKTYDDEYYEMLNQDEDEDGTKVVSKKKPERSNDFND